MNSYTLHLSSNNTSTIRHIPQLEFDDFTKLTIDLSGVAESVLPKYLKIDWGLGETPETYDNDVYRLGRTSINALRFSPMLTAKYEKEYYPSAYALYKTLSAQVLVNYTTGDNSWFVIPIRIRTNDYFESLGDLKLINSNILPLSGNPIEYQLLSTKNNQTIEFRND